MRYCCKCSYQVTINNKTIYVSTSWTYKVLTTNTQEYCEESNQHPPPTVFSITRQESCLLHSMIYYLFSHASLLFTCKILYLDNLLISVDLSLQIYGQLCTLLLIKQSLFFTTFVLQNVYKYYICKCCVRFLRSRFLITPLPLLLKLNVQDIRTSSWYCICWF